MAAVVLFLSMSVMLAAVHAHQSGPKLSFYNYSGMLATISCMDHPPTILEAGKTFSIPLTRGNQACLVTLKDGEHASVAIDKMLPRSSSSDLSVSVDINDSYLFFSLDETVHHQYVNYQNSQGERIQIQRSSDLQLWSAEESADEWLFKQCLLYCLKHLSRFCIKDSRLIIKAMEEW